LETVSPGRCPPVLHRAEAAVLMRAGWQVARNPSGGQGKLRNGCIRASSASPEISTPCFSGVLRAERAKVNRFNGFRPAVSAALDNAGMHPHILPNPFFAFQSATSQYFISTVLSYAQAR
jgi:hypothetical protein